MKILVLEDNLDRIAWFTEEFSKFELYIAMTAEKAAEAIARYEFDIIFLDHDLGDFDVDGNKLVEVDRSKRSGYDFAKLLSKEIEEGRITNDPSIYIHSLNPVGVANIKSVLKDAIVCPFYSLVLPKMKIVITD